MANPKHTAPPIERPAPRSEIILDESSKKVTVIYKNGDDYAKNHKLDNEHVEALPGYSVKCASLGPLASSARAPWPLKCEWELTVTSNSR